MLEEYGKTCRTQGKKSHPVSIRINPGEGTGHSKKTNTGGPYSKHGIWYQNLSKAKQIAKKSLEIAAELCIYTNNQITVIEEK